MIKVINVAAKKGMTRKRRKGEQRENIYIERVKEERW
jgi:hypothetical protein